MIPDRPLARDEVSEQLLGRTWEYLNKPAKVSAPSEIASMILIERMLRRPIMPEEDRPPENIDFPRLLSSHVVSYSYWFVHADFPSFGSAIPKPR